MANHIWTPVDADVDGCGELLICYRNERGDEHVHSAECWGNEDNPHSLCWNGCSGDWPGCKADCPLFTGTEAKR